MLKALFFIISLLLLLGSEAQPPEPDSARPEPPSSIFDRVEVEASYPGGNKAWTRFVIKNVDGDVPTRRKAPPGVYTVIIQFIVDKEGNLTSFRPLTQHGYGMEEEVIRALKKSPRWIPASQNGRIVKAYRKQPVTFQVLEEKKKKKKKDEQE